MNKKTYIAKGEGMWLPNAMPIKRLEQEYGLAIDDDWTESVQKACVRMNNGGSASFVSAHGLLFTNHHVAESILYDMSNATKDYVRDGYYALTLKNEIPAPNLEVNILWEIEDVTERVVSTQMKSKTQAQNQKARNAIIATIEQESKKSTGMRSDVVTLYRGGAYHLYRYRLYTDVRLVFAPERAIAAHGGDYDNYEYPRYCLDGAFFRVYENNKPLSVKHYFTWETKNTPLNTPCFVAGHPGTTERLSTLARVSYLQDHGLPSMLNLIRRFEISMQQFGGRSPEHERRAQEQLFSYQNVRKRWAGMLSALQEPAFIAKLAEREAFVTAQAKRDPKLYRSYTQALKQIERVQVRALELREEYNLFEGMRGFRTKYAQIARALIRLAEEDTKPNSKRLQEYGDARRDSLLHDLYSPAPIYDDLEKYMLADSLALLLETYGADNPRIKKILSGLSPKARAEQIIRGTKLGAVKTRKRLVAGGKKAIAVSNDPMIKLMVLIDAESRIIRSKVEVEIDQVEQEAYGTIARVQFALFGTNVYPDATFTLRISCGEVVPYTLAPVQEGSYTTIGGVFDHADLHERNRPWHLPKRWLEREQVLRKDTSAFNIITTHDTHGGNSGSPIFTVDRKIIGILFDGLTESQGDTYQYMSNLKEHSLSVHTAGMYSVLKQVYKADRLIKELAA